MVIAIIMSAYDLRLIKVTVFTASAFVNSTMSIFISVSRRRTNGSKAKQKRPGVIARVGAAFGVRIHF